MTAINGMTMMTKQIRIKNDLTRALNLIQELLEENCRLKKEVNIVKAVLNNLISGLPGKNRQEIKRLLNDKNN